MAGKGDRSRIKDHKVFAENYDNIFRKEAPSEKPTTTPKPTPQTPKKNDI